MDPGKNGLPVAISKNIHPTPLKTKHTKSQRRKSRNRVNSCNTYRYMLHKCYQLRNYNTDKLLFNFNILYYCSLYLSNSLFGANYSHDFLTTYRFELNTLLTPVVHLVVYTYKYKPRNFILTPVKS